MPLLLLGSLAVADAQAELTGEVVGDYAGSEAGSVAVLGDLDGDGDAELAVGAFSADASATDSGAVYLLREPPSGGGSLADAERIDGATVGDWAGQALADAGDVDGDGLADLWVGAPAAKNAAGTITAGRAYLVLGPAEITTLADADTVLVADNPRQVLGQAIGGAGDLDGDGLPVVVIGAPDWLMQLDGHAYALLGTQRGTLACADTWATFSPAVPDEQLGRTIALADVDGDDAADVVIGASSNEGWATPGSVYVFHGPLSPGAISTGDATASLRGEATMDRAGDGLAVGDANADGIDDVLVGAFGNDASTGAAYVLYGGY